MQNNKATAYQIFANDSLTNNHLNRLILVYASSGMVLEAYETSSKEPNYASHLEHRKLAKLPLENLMPYQYEQKKANHQHLLAL